MILLYKEVGESCSFPVFKVCPAYRQDKTITWFWSAQHPVSPVFIEVSRPYSCDFSVSLSTQICLALPSGTWVQPRTPLGLA